MTVFGNIKLKNIDEFVEWLDKYCSFETAPYMLWFENNYCKKCKPEVVYDPETDTDFCNMYCELHDKCKYFKHLEDIPDIKEIIKMWLESEVNEDEL